MAQHVMNRRRVGTFWNYWTQKAFGVNLGNWLILERWMGGDVFDQIDPQPTPNYWQVKDEWTLCEKAENAAALLKEHWDTWVTEADFQSLAKVHVNHIRIPVGYWAFITPDQDEPYVSGGQKEQIERILGYCATYNNMVAIIDLHGLPGSQNGEMHSGHIGDKDFYTSTNVDRALKTVTAVVEWMNALDDRLKNQISAIEAANEPTPNNEAQFNMLCDYYQRAYTIIGASPYKVPMIFHDAFKGLAKWNGFLTCDDNAVIDLHPYWAFNEAATEDDNTILDDIGKMSAGPEQFHLPVLYGEWSLASGVTRTDIWLCQFLGAQVAAYQEGHNAAGGTFWALKNNNNYGGDYLEWSFEKLMDRGIINEETFSSHPSAER